MTDQQYNTLRNMMQELLEKQKVVLNNQVITGNKLNALQQDVNSIKTSEGRILGELDRIKRNTNK
ncbi:hypothetical protein [uncultured Hymenobacter sp.]|uniref:hypothetical protein n=1 Tax=uncultured Hymenobacter sp. TaxID=170016 RepID=UPI0035C9AAB2